MVFTKEQLDRFWAKVDKSGDCWEWRAAINKNGYGVLTINRKHWSAHRFAYTSLCGPIKGVIIHSCDNPKCVKVAHLRDGTMSDNMKDMASKGRSFHSKRTKCNHGHLFTPDNTLISKRATRGTCRRCRECLRLRSTKVNEVNRLVKRSMAIFDPC